MVPFFFGDVYDNTMDNLPVTCVACGTNICFRCFSFYANHYQKADATRRGSGIVFPHSWATRSSTVQNLRMSDPLNNAIGTMREWSSATIVRDNEP